MRATCPSLLDLPAESPQGWMPRTSGFPQRPQASGSHVSQSPQGGGGRTATQSLHSYASEPRTQSEAERAFEEFRSVGDRLRALNERVRRETIYPYGGAARPPPFRVGGASWEDDCALAGGQGEIGVSGVDLVNMRGRVNELGIKTCEDLRGLM